MRPSLFLAWCVLAAFAAAPASASAQVEQVRHDRSGSMYRFFVDDLDGASLGTAGFTLTIRPEAARTQLVRPRIDFVQPMLRSVEDI